MEALRRNTHTHIPRHTFSHTRGHLPSNSSSSSIFHRQLKLGKALLNDIAKNLMYMRKEATNNKKNVFIFIQYKQAMNYFKFKYTYIHTYIHLRFSLKKRKNKKKIRGKESHRHR